MVPYPICHCNAFIGFTLLSRVIHLEECSIYSRFNGLKSSKCKNDGREGNIGLDITCLPDEKHVPALRRTPKIFYATYQLFRLDKRREIRVPSDLIQYV